MAALNKTAKYAGLTADYHFQPIAVETLGSAKWAGVAKYVRPLKVRPRGEDLVEIKSPGAEICPK